MELEVRFKPSERALSTLNQGPAWDLMQKVKQEPKYDTVNRPLGLIDLSGALNTLMTGWVDMVAWTLCDQGDAVLYFTPNFYMLDFDLTARAAVLPVPISTAGIDDPFGDSAIPFLADRLDLALQDTHNRGIRCSALFVCNPANPPKVAAIVLKHSVHSLFGLLLVAYTSSLMRYTLFQTSEMTTTPPLCDERAEKSVHVLYSLSKDFNMVGLRMGFFVTRNSAVRDAALSLQPQLVQDYLVQYRHGLREAYKSATRALEQCQIPFTRANAGLFVFIDLSQWIVYFDGSDQATTAEQQLSNWLIEHGVFLNAGEFAGSEKPGQFRLVFTRDRSVVEIAIRRIRSAIDKLGQ
ncbi:unnamed protein product [Clonostachys rhizophaga]|uniref:Aminotransferase class I/classII large domain-containing protein n=1 Tax=Clonostachys rhizophaga TaxID=160324 RepID=A0A9N9YF15_9HYPO|nr:unnamed protein product [Clonostachys rhizophaga]